MHILTFSAIVMALIVGQFVLNFIAPPYTIDPWECQNSAIAIYYFIQVTTVIIVIIYVFYKGLKDRPYVE